MQKYCVGFIIMVVMLCSTLEQDRACMNDSSILEIHFQDFFVNDKVRLTINDCEVFRSLTLKSNELFGSTGLKVIITKGGKTEILLSFLTEKKVCKSKGQTIKIVILVNDRENKFVVDPRNGKYVGFSKKNGDELIMLQSQLSFEYD